MKRILIATDFSPASHNAALYGAKMASLVEGGIVLLHVYQLPVPSAEISIAIAEEETRDEAEEKMAALKKELEQAHGAGLTIEAMVVAGSFFTELKKICEAVKPYAVIVGSQGNTAAERFLFGSQAVNTMKHLTWPVISVPLHSAFTPVKKIGLACDFDNVIDSMRIGEIKRLVNDFGAELHVLNTGKKTAVKPDVVFESGMLLGMLKSLHPKYHFISSEKTEDSILDFAEKNKLDLIIVLPKAHNLVEKLFGKSHTKQFVLQSHIPVMALHL